MIELDRGTPVGVVGAGTMGAGIAQVAALAGHPVWLYDAVPGAAEESIARVRGRIARLTEKGRLDAAVALDTSDRLSPASSVTDLGDCRLVIEAVVENLSVKQELFATLEAFCAPDAILATNTSSLSITDVAAELERPERVAGLHFFNPAPLLPLVEVVSGDATDPAVADALVDAASRWGKSPVRCTSTPGFIVNRVARPFYAEAFRLLSSQTIDPATLDAIMRESGGFRMGPCELTDLIGQDVSAAVTRSVWSAFGEDPRFEPSELQDAMVDAGQLGRKAGIGFYEGTAKPAPVTAASCPPPKGLTVNGIGPLSALVRRLEAAGYPAPATRDAGPARIRPAADVVLQLTDGRTAAKATAETGETTLLVDLAADFETAPRLVLAAAPDTSPDAVSAAVGCLQAAGAAVTIVADTPGLIVARTVAMLAAFGADAVDAGVATADDVDTAMRLGVNYPAGPMAWGETLGWNWVAGVLDALAAAEDQRRYRVSEGLRQRAGHGASLG
jgi:3-hydroxybutyryl-CoA dehydrogenase